MNFVNSMAFTAITFVAFTALVALISWWKTRGDNLDTQDGYYLGGRSLTGPVIAGSLLMTNLSAEQLVGNNGQAVRVGMSTMGWEVTSAIALVILAFVLMPKYLKTGLTTVPQFFEQRYDSVREAAGIRNVVQQQPKACPRSSPIWPARSISSRRRRATRTWAASRAQAHRAARRATS